MLTPDVCFAAATAILAMAFDDLWLGRCHSDIIVRGSGIGTLGEPNGFDDRVTRGGSWFPAGRRPSCRPLGDGRAAPASPSSRSASGRRRPVGRGPAPARRPRRPPEATTSMADAEDHHLALDDQGTRIMKRWRRARPPVGTGEPTPPVGELETARHQPAVLHSHPRAAGSRHRGRVATCEAHGFHCGGSP